MARDFGFGVDVVGIERFQDPATVDKLHWRPKWTIEKYVSDEAFARGECFDRSEINDNLLLNEGIARMLNLLIGGGGTAFSNANARIGVGDSSTAESAAHTDLQAATNKAYKAMDASYPSISGQTVTFKSTFGGTDANYAWNEFTVDNGAVSLENLNRKVSAQGTKTSGQTWVVTLQITIS